MRHFTSRPKLGLLALAVLTSVAFAIAFGGAARTATPVASSVAGVSRDSAAAPSHEPQTARLGATNSLVGSKARQFLLTRAHSAVFNVRKLKSVVVKRERPEDPADPFG